jgi:2-oxoglutarate ferredoxin oxidoreductase subunit alpha
MIAQMMEAGVKIGDFKELPSPDELAKRPYVIDRTRQIGQKFVFDTPRHGVSKKGGVNIEANYRDLVKMYDEWHDTEVRYEEYMMDDVEYVILAWGSAARIAKTAIKRLREEGIKVGLFRAISLYPFPKYQIAALSKDKIKAALTVEIAVPPQFYYDVAAQLDRGIKHESFSQLCSAIMNADDIIEAFKKII